MEWIKVEDGLPMESSSRYEHSRENNCLTLFDDYGHFRQIILSRKVVNKVSRDYNNVWGGMIIIAWQDLPKDPKS